MKKQYLMSMNRKDAKEIHDQLFPAFKRMPEFDSLPKNGTEQVNNPCIASIASGEFCFGLANVGNGVFNLYQYE